MNTSITPTSVTFYKDEVSAFLANDGEVYAAANNILRNIGFNEDRVKAIRKKWRDDRVVSNLGRNFTLATGYGDKETYCLSTKILPLALAKISITPELEKSYPEVVEKLVRYQLECADVLYKHFMQKSVSTRQDVQSRVDKPLTRDDMAKLMIYLNKLWMDYTAYNDGKIDKLLAAIEIQNEKCSVETRQKQYTSLTFTSTPSKVGECIKAIAKKRGVTYTNAAHFAYREIERRTGCDLKKEAAVFAAKHGYKNCRKPYYVGNTERYFNVLKEIANE